MTVLDDSNWSHKAWMSVVDADLFESLLLSRIRGGHIDVLEWGSGRSTFYFAGLLTKLGYSFRWVSLEYDRGYFNGEVVPRIGELPSCSVSYVGGATGQQVAIPQAVSERRQQVDFVVFDHGKLQPYLGDHAEDRVVNMDAYVDWPNGAEQLFDMVLVDGRKRRRCLLVASKLLQEQGVTVIHDAQRPYYACAYEAYRSHLAIGEILHICSNMADSELMHLMTEVQHQ